MEASPSSSVALQAPKSRGELVEKLQNDPRVHTVIPRTPYGIAVILKKEAAINDIYSCAEMLSTCGITARFDKDKLIFENPGEEIRMSSGESTHRKYDFVFSGIGDELYRALYQCW